MIAKPPPFRLAVVLSHPTQYYSPWFRWLAAHTDIAVRVYYLWNFGVTAQRDPKFETTFKWDTDLLSGYESEFVPNAAADPGTHHFGGLRNPTVTQQLAAWSPHAVLLFGYKWATHLRIIAWARTRRVPLIFRGDSHFLGRGAPAWPRRCLLRLVYAQFAAVLPVGAANAEYFSRLGVPSRRQFFAPHSVDTALFDLHNDVHVTRALALREQLGLERKQTVVLFAGKLVPEKQPHALLNAFIEIAPPNSALVFVGDGPEKSSLVERARSNARGTIFFLPFANQSEMPARYALADVFALPSASFYETWGLAVNEAMHMGVPALVSDLVGCQRDLVTDGQTGWVFKAGDNPALIRALATALREVGDVDRREQLRGAVHNRVAGYTYEQTTHGLMAALRSIRPDEVVP